VLLLRVPSSSSPAKGLYNPKAFITHAASLDQGCPHCPRFPTAASRRSLGRVSVPVWLIVLSDQLPIIAMVGRYPTNKLIGRGPIPSRLNFAPGRDPGDHPVLAAVSRGCPGAWGRFPRATHPSATRADPEGPTPVRLACVRRAASVRSEPGSNSQFHHPTVLPKGARAPGAPAGLPATRHRKTIADGIPRRRSKVNAWPPRPRGRGTGCPDRPTPKGRRLRIPSSSSPLCQTARASPALAPQAAARGPPGRAAAMSRKAPRSPPEPPLCRPARLGVQAPFALAAPLPLPPR
jgi:hypothetical protein